MTSCWTPSTQTSALWVRSAVTAIQDALWEAQVLVWLRIQTLSAHVHKQAQEGLRAPASLEQALEVYICLHQVVVRYIVSLNELEMLCIRSCPGYVPGPQQGSGDGISGTKEIACMKGKTFKAGPSGSGFQLQK